jgi:hypothetical protein
MVARRFKGVPGWFYTKTKKAPKKQVDKYTPSETAIELYLSKNEIGTREFNELKQFAKVDLFNDLKKIEEQIDVYRK